MTPALDTPKPKRRQGNAEAMIQASVVAYIRHCAPQVFVCAIPNGGLRSKREAAKLKWTGVVAGVPDLCIIMPGGRALFLEVKTPAGVLSSEQREIFARLDELQCPCDVVRGIDDVRRVLAAVGIKTRETML